MTFDKLLHNLSEHLWVILLSLSVLYELGRLDIILRKNQELLEKVKKELESNTP